VALGEEAKKLGIKINVKSAPWAECRIARNIPTNWSYGEADPIGVYRQYHSSQVDVNKIGNPSTYKNAEVDALLDKAILSANRDEANKLWKQALVTAEKDVPSLAICSPQSVYFVRDGLQIPDFGKVITRSQGVSIVENMNEWTWK
jgi:peptide/nickel transport system substrate-binding protein